MLLHSEGMDSSELLKMVSQEGGDEAETEDGQLQQYITQALDVLKEEGELEDSKDGAEEGSSK